MQPYTEQLRPIAMQHAPLRALPLASLLALSHGRRKEASEEAQRDLASKMAKLEAQREALERQLLEARAAAILNDRLLELGRCAHSTVE
jgi:hypothetical protein